jgi:hypothetical protein
LENIFLPFGIMASEVAKVSVFDDRIIQTKPKYAVEKGALSLTNSPYTAIAATTSQQSFNVIVPSENVFIDRAVDWTCDLYFSMVVTPRNTATGAALGAATARGTPLCVIGRDVALAPFPLHQCVNTMSATINDTTTVINTADVLNQVLRLTDYKAHRAQRTCAHQLDKYLNIPPTTQFVNSPHHGFETAKATDEVANGSYWKWTWTTSAGVALAGTQASPQAINNGGADQYEAVNGVPVSNGTQVGPFTLYAKITSTEKLVLPPFIFGDAFEHSSTGLFGVQNIQLVMNLQNPTRLLRNPLTEDTAEGAGGGDEFSSKEISSVAYNTTPTNGAWQNCKINVQYLTPSLDVPLPPRSIVPYQEYPRYISNAFTATAYSPTATTWRGQQLQTQTITLPSIPDLLMIYIKPISTDAVLTPKVGDFVCPISNISINFDNFSGLLSSHTQEELYKMSVANGLDMDFPSWAGATIAGVPTGQVGAGYYGNARTGGQFGRGVAAGNAVTGTLLPLCGGPLLLKPGKDIVLQAGQAPGLVGNFTFQANVTFDNYSAATTLYCYVVAINSGFFETIKGSSRIIKGVLTEQDIISAPSADVTTMGALRRLTGAGAMTASGVQEVAGVVDSAAKPSGRGMPMGSGSGGRMSGYVM